MNYLPPNTDIDKLFRDINEMLLTNGAQTLVSGYQIAAEGIFIALVHDNLMVVLKSPWDQLMPLIKELIPSAAPRYVDPTIIKFPCREPQQYFQPIISYMHHGGYRPIDLKLGSNSLSFIVGVGDNLIIEAEDAGLRFMASSDEARLITQFLINTFS